VDILTGQVRDEDVFNTFNISILGVQLQHIRDDVIGKGYATALKTNELDNPTSRMTHTFIMSKVRSAASPSPA
jgi:hypothetical protein